MIETRLYLFGAPRIERDGKNIGLGLRKALAMIAYLSVTEQAQSRDFLAGLLWPESDQSTARSNLRRTLYFVQQNVGDGFLAVSKENLTISPDAHLWLDIKIFRQKINACLAENLLSWQCKKELEEAAMLYTDDFMAGFSVPDSEAFEEWQFFEREGLRQDLAGVLKKLAQYYLLNENPNSAIPHARRWLALDHLDEPAHRMLMELYARTDQLAAALRQYQECCRLLDEALGVTPEPETVELYEAIKAGKRFSTAPRVFQIPEIHYVQSGDVHIAYQMLGSGPVDLLIVPGFVSHLEEIWESPSLAQTLRHLARRFRLILFDKRGVGLSDRVGYPPTLEHTMDDILSVLNAAGSEQAVLFGFSEGGPNSLVFCAAHPERVRGLILYGTLAKGTGSPDYPWVLTGEQHAKWMDWLLSTWGKPVPHLYFAPSRASDQGLWEWFAKLLRLGSSPGGIRSVLEVFREIDVRQLLASIHVPTLVIHREGDQAVRVGAGRHLAGHIPGARYVELSGDDHWWWLGDVDSVIKEIETFLSNLNPTSPVDRSLATILCIEIEQQKDPSSELHHPMKSMIDYQVERYRGRRMKNMEHLYLSTFDGPSRAIQCALALCQAGRQNGSPLRITLHSGECFSVGEQLRGEAVEIAQAAIGIAGGEQCVLVSRTVKDLVAGSGFTFKRHGVVAIVQELWEFFRVEGQVTP